MGRFDRSLKWTLNWEGGYSNDPDDPGGATMRGVTQRVYDAYQLSTGRVKAAVRDIAMPTVAKLYEIRYWNPCKAGAFQYPLAQAMFDTAVNFGVGRALQFFNQATGAGSQKKADAKSMAKIRFIASSPSNIQLIIAVKICDLRIAYRHARVKKAPRSVKFLKGWLRRDNALKDLVNSSIG